LSIIIKKNTISFNIKIKPNGLTQDVNNILFLFINDIISEDKQFLSYQEFQNKYLISTNFLEYYGILGAVPKG
jgi:hypothetical protein